MPRALKPQQLEQAVVEIFSRSKSDVIRVKELPEAKAENYKEYFQSKGYKVVMGGVASIVDNSKTVYELHIWRRV